MGYSPTFRAATEGLVRVERLLPGLGEVLVEVGQRVTAETVAAEMAINPARSVVPAGRVLGIRPEKLPSLMTKGPGYAVAQGEVLVTKKGFLGLGSSSCPSPVGGTIKSVSAETGNIVIETSPEPFRLLCGLRGTVVDLWPGLGVTIETPALYFEGLWVIGMETFGVLRQASVGSAEAIDPGSVDERCRDAVLVGGRVDTEGLRKAQAVGAKGVIAGSMDLRAYEWLISQQLYQSPTVVLTEGLGDIPMADSTFSAVVKMDGRNISLLSAGCKGLGPSLAQIVMPLDGGERLNLIEPIMLDRGSRVRVLALSHWGRLGKVVEISALPALVYGERALRGAVVELEGGETITVAADNLEVIG